MKIPLLFLILIVIYYVAADDAEKKSSPKEKPESGGAGGTSSTTASPPRARRSPPRFDANKMKGKYAKSNKTKRSVVPYFDMERTNQQERIISDYLSPTSALIYAAQPRAERRISEPVPST